MCVCMCVCVCVCALSGIHYSVYSPAQSYITECLDNHFGLYASHHQAVLLETFSGHLLLQICMRYHPFQEAF
jgi:hypothetical protein